MHYFYLLPCTCGESVRVLPRNAGETRTCVCGRELTVPNLRQLKKLETVSESESESASRPWSIFRAILFVSGIPVFVIAGGVAIWSIWYSLQFHAGYTNKPTLAQVFAGAPNELFRADIDTMALTDTVESVWKPLLEEANLPDYVEPRYLDLRRQRDRYRRVGAWAAITSVSGLLVALAAVFVRKK